MTGAQFEISIDGVPRTYRDQKGRFAGRADPEVQKSQQCRRLKDLKTGAEITIAFKAANNNGMLTLPIGPLAGLAQVQESRGARS